MIRISAPIVLLILISLSLKAQKTDKTYSRGLEAFYAEDFAGAAAYFQEIESTGDHFKDSEYYLEISLLVQRNNRERSIEKILSFYDRKSKSDKFFFYWIGRIYANRYMFPEAVEAWTRFLKVRNYKSKEIVKETRDFIKETEYLVSYFDNTDNFEIHQLESPINSEFAEMTPVFFSENDELIFASNRDNPTSDRFKIYHTVNQEVDWNEPTPINILGSFSRTNANVEVVNEDGKLFLFSDSKKGGLYYSQPLNDSWSLPKEFDSKINTADVQSHFYINEHEDRIIFSSKDKTQGLQLMQSFRDPVTQEWEKPHLFSYSINSEFDEDSPFLSSDERTLYFSSNRPGGVGGYDVYVSYLDTITRKWSIPENMGWPINSPDDELNFKINPDQLSGYLVSNRIHTMGDLDIFFFWQIEKTRIKGRILDAVTKEPVQDAEIRFHPSLYPDEYFRSALDSTGRYSTDIISDETFTVEVIQDMDTLLEEIFTVQSEKGSLVTHYKDFYVLPEDLSASEKRSLHDQLYGDETVTKNEQSQVKEEFSLEKDVQEEMEQIETTRNGAGFVAQKNIILKNVYFEFGTSALTGASEPILTRLYKILHESPNLRIEISGHTDNVGSRQANQIISKRRAEAVKNWLTAHGISGSRLETVGYGSSRPIASNDDEIDGRALNRRIEITVLR